LITVDCLRADFLGCLGGETSFTPYIDMLSKDSLMFTRAFANGPTTSESFPAILTSTYFLMHGGLRLLPHFTTLAEVLSNNGLKTVAFHSNPFLSKGLGWGRGFREFYDFMNIIEGPLTIITGQQDRSLASKLAWFASASLQKVHIVKIEHLLRDIYYKFSRFQIPYIEGRELNNYVVNWIEKNKDKKFFLWMHYMDPHWPFIPPEPYLWDFSSRQEAFVFCMSVDYEKPSKDELEILRSLYSEEVKYVDLCIGDFLRYLEDKRLLDASLILLMADHGHAFMEHGRFGHTYDMLNNEVLHVPLILYGSEHSKSIKIPVQLLDVPPTITDILDLEKPPSFMGKSLIQIQEVSRQPTPIISESAKPDLNNLRYDTSKKVISCIVGKWKIIVNEILKSVELYDIERDFKEKNDMATTETKKEKNLKSLIQKHLIKERLWRTKAILPAKFKPSKTENYDD